MHKPTVAFAALLLLGATSFAQVNTASLTGLVKDSSDAVIADAKVNATNTATGVERTTLTDSTGYYFLANLPIGAYTISIEKPGFQKAVATVNLDAAQKGRQDFALAVGTVTTVTTVEATTPQLSTQDASLSAVVENQYVTQFPLLLRSWDDLVNLVAGVQGQRYTDQGGSTSAGRTGGFNVHGIRQLQNNFILDGLDNNSISENVQELTTQVIRPSVDTIQEFKIITNAYSAEYGRNPGAAISVVTKGGTNQIHGLAYEYLRNRVFDANDFFSNRQGLAKPQNIQNQYGGDAGGPIVKNKLFLFFDYEGTKIRRGALRSTSVPTANERIGDFSTAAAALVHTTYPVIYDQTTGAPFANNQVPQAKIDPLAAKIMALFPSPTVPGLALNNFFRNAGLLDDGGRFSGRIDWQPDSRNTVFTRITFTNRNRFIPGNFGGIADGTSSSSQGRQQLTAYQVSSGWTRPIGDHLVNELRLGYGRDNSQAEQDPFGLNHTGDFVPGVPADPTFDGGVPMITFANVNTFIGSPNFLPKHQITQQYEFTDTLSWTRGKHSLKFGADLRAPLRNNFQDVPATRGALNFDKIFTCLRQANNQCAANTGLSYADFLVGSVQTAQLSNPFQVDQRLHMYSGFAQDDFKVTPRLTMNLGIRYDFATPVYDAKNHLANFNPAGAGSLVFASDGPLYNRTLVQPNRHNFAPRVGLAFQLNPKSVVRAGYGIFYTPFERIGSEDQLALNPPSFINNNISLPSTAAAPLFLLKNGFPANFLDPSQLVLTRVRIRAGNPEAPSTYVQQWSFGVQRELPLGMFVEADYVGTKSTHLNTLRNFNQPINGVVPYPNFGQIEYRDPLGNAVYHGLDFTVERRFKAGLAFRAAYTYSKSIDNTAEHLSAYGSNSFGQNGRDFKSWRGLSDFDVPQRLVFSYVYELPFGKGKPLASSGILSYIVGGFQTSGALTLASGRPFTIFASSNNSSIDIGLQQALANVIGTPVMPQTVTCWYYASKNAGCNGISGTDAFATPPAGVFGNEGRNTLRGPGTKVFDFSLARNIAVTEHAQLQFRWEVFNLTNTVQFALPNTNISGGTPGVITALAGDPRLMQFALRLKF
jgi:carboxypeptidase family protein/TonB-dependent receptor-like protein